MPTYRDDDRDDDAIIRESLPSVISTASIQNIVEESTQFRRDQKAKQMKQQLEFENIRNSKLSELQIQRQRDKDLADKKAYLMQRGWLRLPQPNERFYRTDICSCCDAPVAFLAENSPNRKDMFTDIAYNPISSTNTQQPLKTPSFGAEKLEQHLCSDLDTSKMQKVIQYLLKSNLELKTELVRSEKRLFENIRAYSMQLGR